MKSKYLDKFSSMFKELEGKVVLRGNALLIEIIEEEEVVTAGGIVISPDAAQVRGGINNNLAKIGLVLAAGEGYYNKETGEMIPLDIPVGAIVMHPPYSITEYSTFPGLAGITGGKLGIIGDNEVNLFFDNMETYEKARGLLNE